MRKVHFLIAFVVVLLDRLSKFAVERNIPLHDGIQIIPKFFRLTHLENRGAAFGLFADSPSEWKVAILISVSLTGLRVVWCLLCKRSYGRCCSGSPAGLPIAWA